MPASLPGIDACAALRSHPPCPTPGARLEIGTAGENGGAVAADDLARLSRSPPLRALRARPAPEFRPARPDDKAAIVSLLAQGRVANFAATKAAVFDWQFVDNPGASGDAPFLVGTVADAVVATIGLLPVKLSMQGKEHAGAWIVDFYVHRDQRSRGLGTRLIEIAGRQAPVLIAFGISNMSDPLFRKLGWKLDSSLETMFYHSAEVGLEGACKNLVSRVRRLAGARHRRHEGIDLSVEASVAAIELDALWDHVAMQYGNAVRRDGTYLTWRYADSPLNSYRWLAARRGGELVALMITRHHAVESVIADYLGPLDDADLLRAMCDSATLDLARSGTRRVRCEATHPAVRRSLANIGYRAFRSGGRFRARLNAPALAASRAAWFIMTGDSDNDLMPP